MGKLAKARMGLKCEAMVNGQSPSLDKAIRLRV